MPASRAVCSGSPFLTRPARIRRSASRDIVMLPCATASRAVTALAPTSTIFTRPRASICDRVAPTLPALPALPALATLRFFAIALSQQKRQALERHRQIDALELHVRRRLQRARGEIEHRLDARGDDQVEDVLRGRRRDGDDGDADPFAPGDLLEIVNVVNRHAQARLL